MIRALKWLALLVIALVVLALLGGSGYRYLFGAHSLDVNGNAAR